MKIVFSHTLPKRVVGIIAGIGAVSCLFVFGLIGASSVISASDRDEFYHQDYIFGEPAEPSDAWRIARGGRLYDKWYAVTDVDKPEATHSAWPASNTKKKGATTWRCKSCHGWDFMGKDGKYASGSYKTGIPGVRGVAGKNIGDIHAILMGDTHGFTHDMIPKNDMLHLSYFLSKGQYDITPYVNADGTVNGNKENGKAVFQNTCAACHGFDGKALNWGDEDKPKYIGTEAQKNPWEVMAKIRHGHPATEMVSFAAFPMEYAADVLAYTQTLPAK